MIRTIKKIIVDRLRINKDKIWVDMYLYVIKVPNNTEFSLAEAIKVASFTHE